MKTLKQIKESISPERRAEIRAVMATRRENDEKKKSADIINRKKQIEQRNRDSEFIAKHLADHHDINASYKPASWSIDRHKMPQTSITVPIEHQSVATKALKKLGYNDSHYITSEIGSSPALSDNPKKKPNEQWKGD